MAEVPGQRAEDWRVDGVPLRVVERLEDYGYFKGFQHVYVAFCGLLNDLDVHVRAGRNVILVCHDCTSSVPNPAGDDWLRYEPRLQTSGTGKASIRLRVREWADHVLFLGYDLTVDDKKKGHGFGKRRIQPIERPHCMAKSRTLTESLILEQWDIALWQRMFSPAASAEGVSSPLPPAGAPPASASATDELLGTLCGIVVTHNITDKVQAAWCKKFNVKALADLNCEQMAAIIAKAREKFGGGK